MSAQGWPRKGILAHESTRWAKAIRSLAKATISKITSPTAYWSTDFHTQRSSFAYHRTSRVSDRFTMPLHNVLVLKAHTRMHTHQASS
eukprot:6204508-Pleurochrysis_carterae.AAC.1